MEFWTEVKVNLTHLVSQMSSEIDNDTLFELVKDLDLAVAEWDFTVKLRDYFNSIDYPEEIV